MPDTAPEPGTSRPRCCGQPMEPRVRKTFRDGRRLVVFGCAKCRKTKPWVQEVEEEKT